MTNPLLAKVKLPGRIFQLPSKGIFYAPGVLAEHVKGGEVEVKPLSAFAEMKLRSPDLLYSGRAVREICFECIPEIHQPENLISKDVDAIFCFLRIATYGSVMTINSTHTCPNRTLHKYEVNIENIILDANNKILDHVDILYSTTLSNGQAIKLKPMKFQDTIDASHLQHEVEKQLAEGITDQGLIEKTMIRDVMSVIESVDNIDDPALIEEWVRALQRTFFDEIIDKAKDASEWGFNLNVKLECKDCKVVYEHSLELDPINFFSG